VVPTTLTIMVVSSVVPVPVGVILLITPVVETDIVSSSYHSLFPTATRLTIVNPC